MRETFDRGISAPPKRWRWAWFWWGLLATTLVTVALVMGGVAWRRLEAAEQAALVAAIERVGGGVYYSHEIRTDEDGIRISGGRNPPGIKGELIDWLGADFVSDVQGVHGYRYDFLRVGVPFDEQATEVFCRAAARFDKLLSFSLASETFRGEHLNQLRQLDALEDLTLAGPNLRDDDLRPLAQAIHLRHLDLDCPQVTDRGLAHLAGLKRLQILTLKCPLVTDRGIQALAPQPELLHLDLSGSGVGDGAVAHFAGSSKLHTLEFAGTAITDQGLAAVKGLPKLQDLWIDQTAIGDAGLAHLAQCGYLGSLSASDTNVTDAGLKTLVGGSGVMYLNLAGTQITDTGCQFVPQLDFSNLDLSRTKVTDAGALVIAAGMKGSRRGRVALQLNETAIGDTGLEALVRSEAFLHLSVQKTAVTQAGVRKCLALKLAEEVQIDSSFTDEELTEMPVDDRLLPP